MEKMKSLYLLSNLNEDTYFKKNVIENIEKDLISKDSLVFIASSPYGYEKTDKYFNINKEWFETEGMKFNNYYLLDYRVNKPDSINYLVNSTCIVLMGGFTREQYAYLKEFNLIEILQGHNGVIIGISAGAINLAEKSLSLRGPKDIETILYDGIGLTDKTIFPHFDINDRNHLDELIKYSNKTVIYGICENSTIIERGSEKIIIGDIYRIFKEKIDKINEF